MLQPKILEVKPMDKYNIMLKYETGEIKVFDVSPYIEGDWFGELADEDYFKTVKVIPGGIGIEWLNGQDIAPHELYELSN
jgi:hypothetical protein